MSARSAVVVVASTRAASGVYQDTTGPMLREWLEGRGWTADVVVLPDGNPIGDAISDAIARGVGLVVTTGGTGVTARDLTPEVTAPLLDRQLPGIAEELRRRGAAQTPAAVLSRGLAGVAGRSLIVNLPGSPGAVRTGIEVLDELVDHIVDQLHGGDHERHG
jgi:molybdenum cofactor synthesis domain-containing protein